MQKYQKKELLYEGRAKKLYLTNEEDKLIQEFKDDATAFDGAKKGTITNKGQINNDISSLTLAICLNFLVFIY